MPRPTLFRRRLAAVVGVALTISSGLFLLAQSAPPLALTLADAERCDAKLQAIVRYAEDRVSRRPVEPQHITTLTEAEVNAYLRLKPPPEMPAGVVDPYISGIGDGRISASATVDLDAVAKSGSGGGLGRLLTGRLPLTLTGTLRGRDGHATFEFESAKLSGIPVPKLLLQQIVGYYSKTAEKPAGVSLDAPFPLPNGIRHLDVQVRQVVIVQ